ncbi:MAG: type IV pilus assembly protein PilM [Fimbriimonas ginsengisoli]|uniref:Type IV pilus assembly protein PilM n=1 Tax=Fimbriimonas ginsengisoli TaxID=1005039 RepID=A0A931LTV7_FIMGI|nr:type IV pilus assembly protein PilM [Fimbriimonas ginsengisoli]
MGLFAKKSYIGLDLGHHMLKAVQLERTHTGWQIAKAAAYPTPPDSIRDGVVVEPQALVAAIKELLKLGHFTATSAHIAVAGGSVVVRNVRIPKMAESTLRKSIKFEASRYVPSSVEESYIDFEILGPADETSMDVVIVAAPKDLVESRIAACEAAGLEIEGVDVEAFAIHRALVESNDERDWSGGTVALIDVGSSMSGLSVVQQGSFAMTRSIPNGGNMLTEALTNYFKLTREQAESGKAQLDAGDLLDAEKPKENPPLRVIQPHLDDLVREVRRSLNYYQSQLAEATPERQVSLTILSGGGSQLVGLSSYMEHKLGIKTVAQEVLDNPRFTSGLDADTPCSGLAVASGLALRTFAKAA